MAEREFLLEVRCEEIPAHMLGPGVRDLGTRLFEELMACRLAPDEVQTSYTPRRLVVALRGLAEREPDRDEELTGPPVSAAYDDAGEPTRALEGFAAKCGVPPEELLQVDTPKGRYLAARRKIEGRATPDVLAELVPRVLRQINWPKTMRWGSGEGPWVRPVHSVVALYAGAVVPFELFGIHSGRTTSGHPLHSPEPFEVSDFADYDAQLRQRSILIDFQERRAQLLAGMEAIAASHSGELVSDSSLVDKLTAICEIPGVVEGSIDDIELPREVLIASLRDHQSALTVEREGTLLPLFLTVMDRPDDPEGRVQRGNEWVVAARLADARFFFQEDRKRSLEERRADLERVTFHEKLGSYAEKGDRIVALSEWLAQQLGLGESLPQVRQAAALLKVDLTTEMVKEFTSLQGVVGGVYARDEGLDTPVWQAIYDQYLPASTSDDIPRGAIGQVVSLADRIDTLVGMFGSGFVPTGSKDPFGLRRVAQGAVRILLQADLELDLDAAIAESLGLFGTRLESDADTVRASLQPFLLDRARYLLGREEFAHDEIEAALGVEGDSLPDTRRRVAALREVREEPGFREIALAAKRIGNILRGVDTQTLDENRLSEPAERALFDAATELDARIQETEVTKSYADGLRSITAFAPVLDHFFVEIMVMDEDPAVRSNRLALLQSTQKILARAAALTEMVVERTSGDEN